VVVALLLIFVIYPVMQKAVQDPKYMRTLMGVMTLGSVLFVLFVECYSFPADIDPHNMASGQKNAYTLLGCMIGMLIVYGVDEKWLHFPVKAVWWAQILKVALGFCAVMIVKSGMKGLLNGLFGEALGRGVRYFLIVIVAGIVWPLTFRWFAKLGKKEP